MEHLHDTTAVTVAEPDRPPIRTRRAPLAALAGAAAIAAMVVGLGVLPGTHEHPAAAALGRLAHTARQLHTAADGDVEYTASVSDYGGGAVRREIWIAPDGSGRIRETHEGEATTDYRYGPGGLLRDDVRDWPTTADGALAKLRAEAATSDMRPIDAEAFVLAGDHLRETAAPPAVRAAIFEAVARLEGVTALGTVHDDTGRAGVGFEITSDADHDGRWQLIFDPATSALLGEREGRRSGALTGWAVYTASEAVASVPDGGDPVPVDPGAAREQGDG